MAINEDDIIYVLTKEDVDDVAKTIGLSNLTDDHYRMARRVSAAIRRTTGSLPSPMRRKTPKRNYGAAIRILNPKNNDGGSWNLALLLC